MWLNTCMWNENLPWENLGLHLFSHLLFFIHNTLLLLLSNLSFYLPCVFLNFFCTWLWNLQPPLNKLCSLCWSVYWYRFLLYWHAILRDTAHFLAGSALSNGKYLHPVPWISYFPFKAVLCIYLFFTPSLKGIKLLSFHLSFFQPCLHSECPHVSSTMLLQSVFLAWSFLLHILLTFSTIIFIALHITRYFYLFRPEFYCLNFKKKCKLIKIISYCLWLSLKVQ